MKTKVIIEEGKTRIILTPDNEFEKRVLIDAENSSKEFNSILESDYSYGNTRENHKLTIEIIKDKQK